MLNKLIEAISANLNIPAFIAIIIYLIKKQYDRADKKFEIKYKLWYDSKTAALKEFDQSYLTALYDCKTAFKSKQNGLGYDRLKIENLIRDFHTKANSLERYTRNNEGLSIGNMINGFFTFQEYIDDVGDPGIANCHIPITYNEGKIYESFSIIESSASSFQAEIKKELNPDRKQNYVLKNLVVFNKKKQKNASELRN